MAPYRILICDDEEEILRYLKKLLKASGYVVETFLSGHLLLSRLERKGEEEPDILIQDVRLPDLDGITILRRVRELRPELPVVIMTAHGTIDAAVEAVKAGAYDYITKPFPVEKILGVVGNIAERDRLLRENRTLREELSREVPSHIVFRSPQFRAVYDMTLQVAASDANVLVLGESGSGKELIAGAVHDNSLRRGKPFLSINCAALSDTLLESQLFGHVRGAFTGAVAAGKGLLEEADGGTLFMDEVGDMSPAIQAKLLRVIQEREFIPVGSTRPKRVDIRFVAATNRELEKEVREGRFREDLYYRLNVISIQIPPLRERREDIDPLARYFLKKFAAKAKKPVTDISSEALGELERYGWPGNIRELANVMERAVILTRGSSVLPEALPLWQQAEAPRLPATGASLEEMEREHIRQTLQKNAFHKSRTAEMLGISRKTLDRKIAEYGIDLGKRQ